MFAPLARWRHPSRSPSATQISHGYDCYPLAGMTTTSYGKHASVLLRDLNRTGKSSNMAGNRKEVKSRKRERAIVRAQLHEGYRLSGNKGSDNKENVRKGSAQAVGKGTKDWALDKNHNTSNTQSYQCCFNRAVWLGPSRDSLHLACSGYLAGASAGLASQPLDRADYARHSSVSGLK